MQSMRSSNTFVGLVGNLDPVNVLVLGVNCLCRSYQAVSVPNMSLLLVAVSSSTCESTAQQNVEDIPE